MIGLYAAVGIAIFGFCAGSVAMFVATMATSEQFDWIVQRNAELEKELDLRRRHAREAGDFIRENARFVRVGKARLASIAKQNERRKSARAAQK